MNCPKCSSPLREGAKFCTACGQKIEAAGTPPAASCPKCGAALRPNAKFCTTCGERLGGAEPSPQPPATSVPAASAPQGKAAPAANVVGSDKAETAVVGQRIYWNIQPGQIARVISETEFESFGGVRGIIVPEGTTAYVRANGRFVAAISGGSYDFVGAPEKVGGNDGVLRRGWRMITDLFRSSAAKEAAKRDAEATSEYERQQRLILENAKNGAAFSIVILLNKAFPLLIGAKQATAEDYRNFVPMKIRTRHLEMDVGVNAYFKITDHEQFVLHYLADRALFNTTHVLDEISEPVRICVQEILQDCEPDERGRVPDELRKALKEALNAEAARGFHGLSIVRVAEITTANEDLARFAELAREMYLSEKELDYLKRTNDFKNRLADATNAQMLHEARTAEDIQAKLDEINRDKLLREDELGKFRTVLENERKIHDAKSDAERDAALAEIRNTGLLREKDLQMLLTQKESALKMMQLKEALDFERVRMQGAQNLEVAAVEHELAITARRDEYADSRFYKDLEKRRAAGDLDFELRNREEEADFARFTAMRNAELEHELARERLNAEKQKDEREQELAMERLRGENAQKLTMEQIFAMNGGSEAAVEFARSLANKHSVEAERAANERVLEAERAAAKRIADTEHAASERAVNAERLASERVADAERAASDRVTRAERAAAEHAMNATREAADHALDAERRASIRAEQESLNRQRFMETVTLQALGSNAVARQAQVAPMPYPQPGYYPPPQGVPAAHGYPPQGYGQAPMPPPNYGQPAPAAYAQPMTPGYAQPAPQNYGQPPSPPGYGQPKSPSEAQPFPPPPAAAPQNPAPAPGANARFCATCGHEIPAGMRFCGQCGTKAE